MQCRTCMHGISSLFRASRQNGSNDDDDDDDDYVDDEIEQLSVLLVCRHQDSTCFWSECISSSSENVIHHLAICHLSFLSSLSNALSG